MIRLILAVIALAAATASQASECNPLVDGQRCYTGRFDPADFTKARRDAAPQSPRVNAVFGSLRTPCLKDNAAPLTELGIIHCVPAWRQPRWPQYLSKPADPGSPEVNKSLCYTLDIAISTESDAVPLVR